VQLLRIQCESGLADLIAGHAVLVICVGDHTDSHTTVYWLKAEVDQRSGKVVSFELQEFTSGNRYHLPHDLSTCDCPDKTFRDDREGGCKHMAALRVALVGMFRETPWKGFSSDDPSLAGRDDDGSEVDLGEASGVIGAVASDDDRAWDQRWTIAG
jgi:hypothetical protein